ncbi:metallophosphoesterase [Roseicitreum antarcticum]|uniref:Serine/threonine protein phosphatase 1 n=1 Tax=Roseicitreum antarcticum TaxID=564137 RepID=A0A1H2X4D4_9RHOB|nr:metallophosphoesterase [Roseicitreum antarcticum]SDW87334.1 serine/threonine protein phosphatase 1 [Roseicitreum antarcticum]
MRTYAIGDIHGHLDLLHIAHARIKADRAACGDADAPIVHLGDLVDRGPDSRGVLAHLRQGIDAGENWVVLKGNHDRMFALFLDDPAAQDDGLRTVYSYLHPAIGGAATLASYGVANPADRPVAQVHIDGVAAVPAPDRAFLRSRPTWYRRGEVVYVHAGIRPGIAMEEQAETDLVWIRAPFLEFTDDHGFLVVHGHTALDAAVHYGNRVNIDSSAAYGGPLTAIVVEGRQTWILTDAGRVPLTPEAPENAAP